MICDSVLRILYNIIKHFKKKLNVYLKNSMLSQYCAMHNVAMEYYHIENGFIRRNPEGKHKETYPEGASDKVLPLKT